MPDRPEKRARHASHQDPLRYDAQAVIRAVGTGLSTLYSSVVSEPPRDRLAALLQQLDQKAPALARAAGTKPDRRK